MPDGHTAQTDRSTHAELPAEARQVMPRTQVAPVDVPTACGPSTQERDGAGRQEEVRDATDQGDGIDGELSSATRVAIT